MSVHLADLSSVKNYKVRLEFTGPLDPSSLAQEMPYVSLLEEIAQPRTRIRRFLTGWADTSSSPGRRFGALAMRPHREASSGASAALVQSRGRALSQRCAH
jgi:hypothetical protein